MLSVEDIRPVGLQPEVEKLLAYVLAMSAARRGLWPVTSTVTMSDWP